MSDQLKWYSGLPFPALKVTARPTKGLKYSFNGQPLLIETEAASSTGGPGGGGDGASKGIILLIGL